MKQVEFPKPPGYTPPEGMDEFDQMATFRKKPNGKMCLVAINGVPMPGYDKKSKPYRDTDKEIGENTAGRYREAMTGMEGGAASSGGMAY